MVFWALILLVCMLFYAMFVRLDRLSHKEERHRIYSKIPEHEPSDAKRHRFCHSTPWDSYQWAAGSLLIAISQIFLGVCFPALSGGELVLAYVWIGLFAVLWINLGIFTCIDPSVGQSAEDAKAQRAQECNPARRLGMMTGKPHRCLLSSMDS